MVLRNRPCLQKRWQHSRRRRLPPHQRGVPERRIPHAAHRRNHRTAHQRQSIFQTGPDQRILPSAHPPGRPQVHGVSVWQETVPVYPHAFWSLFSTPNVPAPDEPSAFPPAIRGMLPGRHCGLFGQRKGTSAPSRRGLQGSRKSQPTLQPRKMPVCRRRDRVSGLQDQPESPKPDHVQGR